MDNIAIIIILYLVIAYLKIGGLGFMSEKIDTYCGLSCETCEYKEKFNCGGCVATEGNPFHGSCRVAECVKARNIRFCGECADFACDLLKEFSNDEVNGDKPKGARIERCKTLKAQLVKEARQGIEPVGYCGHHCDYCFLGQWCGGCRSNYNCCSYATMCKDGVCPNVKCAKEKGLSGCYECADLDKCEKGYYEKTDEYVAKATASFIKKHGLDAYKQSLKKAIDDGVNYPKGFDECGSVEKALELLEKYYI